MYAQEQLAAAAAFQRMSRVPNENNAILLKLRFLSPLTYSCQAGSNLRKKSYPSACHRALPYRNNKAAEVNNSVKWYLSKFKCHKMTLISPHI